MRETFCASLTLCVVVARGPRDFEQHISSLATPVRREQLHREQYPRLHYDTSIRYPRGLFRGTAGGGGGEVFEKRFRARRPRHCRLPSVELLKIFSRDGHILKFIREPLVPYAAINRGTVTHGAFCKTYSTVRCAGCVYYVGTLASDCGCRCC